MKRAHSFCDVPKTIHPRTHFLFAVWFLFFIISFEFEVCVCVLLRMKNINIMPYACDCVNVGVELGRNSPANGHIFILTNFDVWLFFFLLVGLWWNRQIRPISKSTFFLLLHRLLILSTLTLKTHSVLVGSFSSSSSSSCYILHFRHTFSMCAAVLCVLKCLSVLLLFDFDDYSFHW